MQNFKPRNSRDKRFGGKRFEKRRPEGDATDAKVAGTKFFELRIEKMVQGGDGLARLPDGRVCFVAGALPGELCQVMLTFAKKDFTKGRILEVLEPSKDRVKPECTLYGKCGGCSLQHLKIEKQIEAMEQVERENFKRLAHAELPSDFKIHYGKPWGYRNRARVVFDTRRNEFGFRGEESNQVVTFKECPVLTPALNDFLKGEGKCLCEKIAAHAHGHYPLELNVFDNGKGEVSYYYHGMRNDEFRERAVSVVDIDGVKIESDASVFFQSNLSLLPELVNAVRKAVDDGIASGSASDEWLIDLFSGVGFFAAILKDKFKRITTVEREPGCLSHAKVNLAGCNCENVSAPAEDWLRNNVVNVPATLIVDPPRTGLPPEALTAIAESSVNRLIYVSCDPVTLARDYAKFAAAGFTLNHAEGFAFYPETPHMEMMFVLSR